MGNLSNFQLGSGLAQRLLKEDRSGNAAFADACPGFSQPKIDPVNLPKHPIHVARNPFGDFVFYPDFVVAEWIKPELDAFDLMTMASVARGVYGDRPWGYVSNRTHATASNPAAVQQMLRSKDAPCAVAVVTYSLRSLMVAHIEKELCRWVPMEHFFNLLEAMRWMEARMHEVMEPWAVSNELEMEPGSVA
jgi:hypothetical protein